MAEAVVLLLFVARNCVCKQTCIVDCAAQKVYFAYYKDDAWIVPGHLKIAIISAPCAVEDCDLSYSNQSNDAVRLNI